ncbi:MAG: hypothetical protein ABSH03_21390 [Candidatus Lustribacter sp.]|jgi:hypothetical protein
MSAFPPVTLSAVEGQPQSRQVATQTLEAIVFREVLEPLAAALGPVGDAAVGTVADMLFARPKP